MTDTVPNKSWVFKQIPTGFPKHGVDFDYEDRPLSLTPPPGGMTVKMLTVGFDPHQRDRMRGPEWKGYVPSYTPGDTINNFSIAKVVHSDAPGYAEGDLVQGVMPIAEYGIIPAELIGMKPMAAPMIWKVNNKYDLDLAHYMGPLGLAGMTAWVSFYGLIKTQEVKGQTIWVNAASSSVGEIVVQLAKREGMRVIASVSSEDKLRYVVDELGADMGFNYREEKIGDALRRLAPEGLDVVYDNVGGEHFQAAIDNMKWFGKIIVCGMVSQYNTEQPYGVTNLPEIFRRRINIRGFIFWDHDIYPQNIESFKENMPKWLADGSMKAKYTKFDGLENAHEGFLAMYTGKTFGKAVLKISKP